MKPQPLQPPAHGDRRQHHPGPVSNNREQPLAPQRWLALVARCGGPRSQIVERDGGTGQSGRTPSPRRGFHRLLETFLTCRRGLVVARQWSRLVRDHQDGMHRTQRCRGAHVPPVVECFRYHAEGCKRYHHSSGLVIENHHWAEYAQIGSAQGLEVWVAHGHGFVHRITARGCCSPRRHAARWPGRRAGPPRPAHHPSCRIRDGCSAGDRQWLRGGARGVALRGAEGALWTAETGRKTRGPAAVEALPRAAEHHADRATPQGPLRGPRDTAARAPEVRAARTRQQNHSADTRRAARRLPPRLSRDGESFARVRHRRRRACQTRHLPETSGAGTLPLVRRCP
jgi:hypothetical protein